MNSTKSGRALALAALMALLPCAAQAESAPAVKQAMSTAIPTSSPAAQADAAPAGKPAASTVMPTSSPAAQTATPAPTTSAASAAPSAAESPAPSAAPGMGIIASALDARAGLGAQAAPEPAGDVTQGEFSLLILVNRSNPLPEGLVPQLVDIGGGDSVDARCYDDLMLMLDACRQAGLEPVVSSAYRTHDYQTMLYENKISRLIDEGVSAEQAPALAMTVVALPGTSEHQLGLALDIVDASYRQLDEAQEDTAVQRWLMANSYRYGFILRYPSDKSAITGIIYEPWHYRYVGREAAQAIYESGLCLEEFLSRYPNAAG